MQSTITASSPIKTVEERTIKNGNRVDRRKLLSERKITGKRETVEME